MSVVVGLVPALQTFLWVLLLAGILFFGRRQIRKLLEVFRLRLEHDKSIKLTLGKMGAEFERTVGDAVQLAQDPRGSSVALVNELEEQRREIAGSQHGLHLAHIATPSDAPGQKYDLFVFLQAGMHREDYDDLPPDLSDVEAVEFQVGPKFSPSGTTIRNHGQSRLGFRTSAYAPFLCVCRVKFKDGKSPVLISRFIEFSSAQLAEEVIREE